MAATSSTNRDTQSPKTMKVIILDHSSNLRNILIILTKRNPFQFTKINTGTKMMRKKMTRISTSQTLSSNKESSTPSAGKS